MMFKVRQSISKFTAHIEGSWDMEINTSVQETVVYRLKYLDSHTSRSLSSYGSSQMRIGVSPFDTSCWMV